MTRFDGPTNMARDRPLLEASEGEGKVGWRSYGWDVANPSAAFPEPRRRIGKARSDEDAQPQAPIRQNPDPGRCSKHASELSN